MQYSFIGNDFGVFVLGKVVLKKIPQAKISFFLEKEKNISKKELIKESDLWEKSFCKTLKQTRFGRIGIFYDRKNFEIPKFFQKQINKIETFEYHPKEKKRACQKPQITLFKTQILHEFANEGLSDSVEFRRLARKFIRQAKNANCDILFFPESIFGETKTKKILQHLAGTQRKILTVDDFLEVFEAEPKAREIKIFQTQEDQKFVKLRAETILQTKLSESVFE